MGERELKPCPFCGGEAELKFYGSGPATRSGVKCVDVMCAGSMRLPLPEENPVAMWNTRALASRPAVAEGAIGWIDQATLDQLLSAPKDQRTRIHVVGVGLVKVGEAGALIYAAPTAYPSNRPRSIRRRTWK